MAGRHLFGVDLMVLEGRLQVTWTYDPGRHLPATAERLARSFLAELEALVAHCLSPEAGGYTPSDFPLAGLDQAALARLLGADRNVEDLYPLAPLQEGILFHRLYDPGADPYLEQLTARLEGPLDVPAFAAAWQRVVQRHAALRTAFLWKGVDRPLQLVRRRAELPWSIEDWRGEAGWEELLAADRARGFDLGRAPLMRLTLVRMDEHSHRSHRLVWTSHHLIFDGWGFPLILSEVFASYQDPGRPLPPVRPYRDYIAWLAQRDESEAERHWREALRGFAEPTPLPFDRQEGAGEGSFERSVAFPAGEPESLAQRLQVTVNTLIQAAWALLLSRYAPSAADVVFGAVVSGRPAELPGVESIVGLFINTVPVRAAIPEDEPSSAWLARLQAGQIGLRQYQWTPLSRVQALSEVRAGEPLFASLLVFENYPIGPSLSGDLGELRIAEATLDERTNYPLTLIARVSNGLNLSLTADRRFDPATVQRLLGHLGSLLHALAANPSRPPASLHLLSAAERHQLTVEWSDTGRAFSPEPLPRLFEAQALRTPDAPAILCEGESLTYGELDARASLLAGFLRDLGVRRGTIIGLAVERSLEMAVGLLGVLKAGCAYLPLDPSYPEARLRLMLEDSRATLLLTQARLAEALPRSTGLVLLDADWEEISRRTPVAREEYPLPEDLAYVIYTSGSTGRPKGVAIPHGALTNFLLSMREILGFEQEDSVLAVTTVSFDIAGLELFLPLITGARVEVASRETVMDGERLRRQLERSQPTAMQATPTTWRLLLEAGWQGQAGFRILCGGEALDRDLAERLLKGGASVWNLYGPTETTIWSAVRRLHPGDAVSIGRPLANTSMVLVDPWLVPTPPGVPGELLIGGTGLAWGYLHRPDLTAERFVPDPWSELPGARLYRTGDQARFLKTGEIESLGRLDQQVKIRGFRIEPLEVEAALAACPGVLRAAVVGVGGKRLVAFWVGDAGVEELRSQLRARLPEAMVPALFLRLEDLPLTPNGKVDRRALAALALDAGPAVRPPRERVPPRTPVEEQLVEACARVLELDPGTIGVSDSFFDLGGHSLLATRLMSQLHSRLGIEVPLHVIFDTRNLGELADRIVERELDEADDELMEALLAGMGADE